MEGYTRLKLAAACLLITLVRINANQVAASQDHTRQKLHLRSTRSITGEDHEMSAERLGRYLMHKLRYRDEFLEVCKNVAGVSVYSRSLADMDKCLVLGFDQINSNFTALHEWDQTSIVYATLKDLAGDEPNRNSLLKVRLNDSKPKLALAWYKNRKRDIRKKLPKNKEFNELYDKYIVTPCELIVKQDYFAIGGSVANQLYSRLAYNVCKNYVLNPGELSMFPEIVQTEHWKVYYGNPAFIHRLADDQK